VPKFLTLLDQQQQVKKSSEFLCEVDLDADDKDQEAKKICTDQSYHEGWWFSKN
jgi:hypothetical protein